MPEDITPKFGVSVSPKEARVRAAVKAAYEFDPAAGRAGDTILISQHTGRRGDSIRVCPEHSFEAAKVRVIVRDLAGQLLERGFGRNATYRARKDLPTQVVNIEATLWDHAGNKSTKAVQHDLSRGVSSLPRRRRRTYQVRRPSGSQ